MKRGRSAQRGPLRACLLTACVLLTGAASLFLLLFTGPEREQEAPSVSAAQLDAVQLDENERLSGSAGSLAPALPVSLPIFGEANSYQCAKTLESWQFLSDESCANCALVILESIHTQGYELLQAGFMDLSGECWGCVFAGDDGDSLSVTLMPERPFSPRSDDNLLVVHVLHYFGQEGTAW